MFGLFNGFEFFANFISSLADSFTSAFDVIFGPINQAELVFDSILNVTLFPDYIWVPFCGILAVIIVMNIVKLLNYLPLW